QLQDSVTVLRAAVAHVHRSAHQYAVMAAGRDAAEVDVEAAELVHDQVTADPKRAVGRPGLRTGRHPATQVDRTIHRAGARQLAPGPHAEAACGTRSAAIECAVGQLHVKIGGPADT